MKRILTQGSAGRLDRSILDGIASANLKRVFFMSLVAIPVNITHIVIFAMDRPADAIESMWRGGIIVSHGALAVIMCILGIVSYRFMKKPQTNAVIHAIPHLAAATTLAMSVVIVTYDQLVTASITPFMIGCIITSTVFILRPVISLVYFSFASIGYTLSIALTQPDHAVLLSNRVNGLTMVGVGLFISILLWRALTADLQNKHTIAQQQLLLEEKNRELEKLAFHDQLTGLYNRHKFEELLGQSMESNRCGGHPLALMMVDIDHFKPFNDSNGHLAGDRSLMRVASTLEAIALRNGGVMGRFGGEEFLIMLDETTEDASAAIAEEMRKDIEGLCIKNEKTGTNLTISLGVAATGPSSATDPVALIDAADRALYRAKERGRNSVVRFSELDGMPSSTAVSNYPDS